MSNTPQIKRFSQANNSNKSPSHIKNNRKRKDEQPKTPVPRRPSVSAPTTPLSRRHTPSSKPKRSDRMKEITETIKTEMDEKMKKQRASMIISDTKRHELDGLKKRHRSSSAIDQFMYAGPVFNNSPAPSTLPIPSFSPTYVSIEVNQPIHVSSPTPFSLEADLSEIQRKLRSLLKL